MNVTQLDKIIKTSKEMADDYVPHNGDKNGIVCNRCNLIASQEPTCAFYYSKATQVHHCEYCIYDINRLSMSAMLDEMNSENNNA